jgi:ankyrin repeat protein
VFSRDCIICVPNSACEVGQKEIVKILLEHEADGRIHPVTKYSPLYISCYYGRKEIVELLLKVSAIDLSP